MNTRVITKLIEKLGLNDVIAVSTGDKARLAESLRESGHQKESEFIENLSNVEFENYIQDLDPLNY